MKLILALTLLGSTAFAQEKLTQVDLTAECESKIQNEALRAETQYLASAGEILASSLTASANLSYWPAKDDVTIWVRVSDEADGRYVSYSAKVLKTEAAKCNMTLVRDDSSACRYSTDDGPDGLNQIAGLKFRNGRTILPDGKRSTLTNDQITAFLGENDPTANVAELIRGTDDSELSSGTATLPGGRVVTYLGAYGGDNPFGIFFEKGTLTTAGSNSDGSICITPVKK